MREITTRRRSLTLFTALAFGGAAGIGYAQVPTAGDIVACNTEAQHAIRPGTPKPDTAQPNAQDHARAADARRTDGTIPDSRGTRSEDPQLAGMNAAGAKDPAYQAAYRTCMRRAGF
jgi:hypothetical protein